MKSCPLTPDREKKHMARIRSSKPEWWRKAKWCALSREIRFTYKGIWEVMCDDEGRFLADARLIKGDVWPFDDDITVKKIETWLAKLTTVPVTLTTGEQVPSVVLYERDGVRYGILPGFLKHQKISHSTPSKFPSPPNYRANASRAFPEKRRNDSALSGSGAERDLDRDLDVDVDLDLESGAERDLEGDPAQSRREDLDPVVREGDRAAPPAPLVELPVGARRFVEQLYSLASEKRRLDVTRQLYDSLDPRLRGARLRKGVYVKARSPDHLERCCVAVLEDPPRNIDAAIVVLLEKLQDPPPGPTPAEQHKADTSAAIAEEEAYQRAMKAAGIAWANAHPDEYAPILAAVTAEFGANGSSFAKMARDAALAQRCAKAAEFPSFEVWKREGYAPPKPAHA